MCNPTIIFNSLIYSGLLLSGIGIINYTTNKPKIINNDSTITIVKTSIIQNKPLGPLGPL